MAKLKAKVKTLEEVEEAFRPLYEAAEDGDGFLLVPDGVEDIVAPGLKRNQADILREKKALAKKLEALEGIDPELYHRLVQEETERAAHKAKESGEYEKLRQQIVADSAAKIAKAQEVSEKLRKRLVDSTRDSAISRALATVPGARPALLLPILREMVRVEEVDEEFRAVVVDASGTVRVIPATGEHMTPEQLIKELAASDDYAGAFDAPVRSGTGSSTRSDDAPGRAGRARSVKELRTDADKAAYIEKYGLDAFKALPLE